MMNERWFPQNDLKAGPQHEEYGVYLPLLAAIIAGFLGVIFTLGYDSVEQQRSSVALQAFTDELCYEVTQTALPMRHAEVMDKFQKSLNARLSERNVAFKKGVHHGPLDQTRIIGARLIMPLAEPPVTTGTVSSDDIPFSNFSNFSGGPRVCKLDEGGECLFRGRNLADAGAVFPISFWGGPGDDGSNYRGNTVGCEITGRVKGWFSSDRTIRAITVEHQPQRVAPGAYKQRLPNNGITVVIGPQNEYDLSEDDDLLYQPSNYGAAQHAAYRQMVEATSFRVNGSGAPYQRNLLTLFQGVSELVGMLRTGVRDSAGNMHYLQTMAGLKRDLPTGPKASGGTRPVLNQVEQLATACMNPFNLARNSFLVGLVESLGRVHTLENNIEILVMNSRAQDGSAVPAPPVVAVPRGSNVWSRKFVMPLVSRFTTNAVRPWADPFNTSPLSTNVGNNADLPATDPAFMNQISVANQLRWCLDMYRGLLNETGGSIARVETPGVTSGNEDFDDPNWAIANNGELHGPGTNWGQQGIFGIAGTGTLSDGLSASDLVFSLGAVQTCPVEGLGCTKPDPVASTLAPDIKAAADYLSGQAYAFASPGLFPMPGSPPSGGYSTSGSPSGGGGKDWDDALRGYPFGAAEAGVNVAECGNALAPGDRYVHCPNDLSHVIFVLSMPIPHDQVAVIRAAVDRIRAAQRPVTAIYIPARGEYLAEDKIADLYTAFGFSIDDDGTTVDDQQTFALAPTIKIFSPFAYRQMSDVVGSTDLGVTFGTNSGVSPLQQFRNYWTYLTDYLHNPDATAAGESKRGVGSRLLTREARL